MDKKAKYKLLKELLEKEAWVYEFLDEECKAEKELACVAVNNGDVYEYVPEKIKQEKEILIAAIGWGGLPENMAEEWFQDMDILRALVDVEPWNYEEFPEEVQNDRAVALECVKVRGMVYESLPEELKEDAKIMEAAVLHGLDLKELTEYGKPFCEAAKQLLDREDLVRAAVEENGGNQMLYAGEALWKKKKMVALALDKGFCHVRHLPEKLAAEKETVKRVIQNIPEEDYSDEYWQIIYLPEQLRFDKEYLLELIGLHEMVFRTIVQSQKNPRIEELYAKFPKLDNDFCKKAYAVNKKCMKYMNKEMKAVVKK